MGVISQGERIKSEREIVRTSMNLITCFDCWNAYAYPDGT